ncbi:MAG: LysR family transcriptional regulator [Christensenellales bacterium]
MNTEQLKAFIAVYELRSFSKAAKKLIKSQSAVTQAVQSLERELGVSLFLRYARPVQSSEDGELFYPHALNALSSLQNGIDALRARQGRRETFTLSYRTTFNNVIDRFLYFSKSDEIPHIRNISLQDYTSTDHWEENTLYFVRDNIVQSKQIAFMPAWESKAYAMVSVSSPLASKESLCMKDLFGKTAVLPRKELATTFAASLYKRFEAEPKITIRPIDPDSTRICVQLYDCISFCTSEFIQKHDSFTYIPFLDIGPIQYGFASITDFSPAMKRLIQRFIRWQKDNVQN